MALGLLLALPLAQAQDALSWPDELDIGVHVTALGVAGELIVELDNPAIDEMGVRVGLSTGLDAWEGDAIYVGYGVLTATFRDDKILQFEGHGGPSMTMKYSGLFFGWRAGVAAVINTGDHAALRFGLSGSVPLIEFLPRFQVATGESEVAFIPEVGVSFRF